MPAVIRFRTMPTVASGTDAATGNIGASCSFPTALPCRCWSRRPPLSRLDLRDLLEILMTWPEAMLPELQANVGAVMGEHVTDAIADRHFKRWALVVRGGTR